jgi:hypothetical protein
MHIKDAAKIMVAIAVVSLSSITCLAQIDRTPVRLHFPAGRNTATARGTIGGESTDYYVVHAKAGQKLIVRAVSPHMCTHVIVSQVEGDVDLSEKAQRMDLTHWDGKAPRTGDYRIEITAFPDVEDYTLYVTVL